MNGRPILFLSRSLAAFGRLVRPLFVLGAMVSVLAVASEVRAGMILATQADGAIQSADEGLTAAPCGAPREDDRDDELVTLTHGALPNGAESPSGANAGGVSSFAAILPQCIARPPLLESSFIEERSLSLPDSPVFDRLRPPRA